MLLALAPLVFNNNTSQEEVIFEFGCSEVSLSSSHGLGSVVVKDIMSLMSNQTGILSKVELAVLPVSVINMITQSTYSPQSKQQISISSNVANATTPVTIKTTGKITLNVSQIQALTSVLGGCEFVMNAVQMAVEAICKPKPSSKYSVSNSNVLTTVSLSQNCISKIDINPVLLNNESTFKINSKTNVVVSSQLLAQFNAPVSFVAFRCLPSPMTPQVNVIPKPTFTKQLLTNVTLNGSIVSKSAQKVTINQNNVQAIQGTPKLSISSVLSFNTKLTGNTNIAIHSFTGLRWQGESIYPSSDVTPKTHAVKIVSSNLDTTSVVMPLPKPKILIEPQTIGAISSITANVKLPINIGNLVKSSAEMDLIPKFDVIIPKFNADADVFMNTIPVVSMVGSFEINSEVYVKLSYHPVIRHFVSEIVETKTLYVGSIEELFPITGMNVVDRPIPIFEYKEA